MFCCDKQKPAYEWRISDWRSDVCSADQPAQHQSGVGGGGVGAAMAIGRGPRPGARRLRPDMELATLVDPGDRPAAIADLDDLGHRRLDRIARIPGVALDMIFGGYLDLAALDQGAFRSGPADVEDRKSTRLNSSH